jgi:hypothetical protein
MPTSDIFIELAERSQQCREVAAGLPVVGQPDSGGGDGR